MRQLTWVLLAIAAVLLIALYLYGKWQERKSARLDDAEGDVTARRWTAVLPARTSSARNARNSSQAPVRIEPTMGLSARARSEASEPSSDDASAETQPVGGWVEDALLDVMLELRCVHAFDGVAALEARAQLDRLALPLPIHLAVWDSKAGRWSLPDRFGFYSEMLIAVQLATRRHSLGEIDASRFIAAVQQIARIDRRRLRPARCCAAGAAGSGTRCVMRALRCADNTDTGGTGGAMEPRQCRCSGDRGGSERR